jgi:hypothetical protein
MHTMSKHSVLLQYRPPGRSVWGDITELPSRTAAMQAFFRIDDLLVENGYADSPDYPERITDGDDVRVVIRFQPCANAPIDEVCQYGYGSAGRCEADAIVDTPYMGRSWAYLCGLHWAAVGSQIPGQVNVLTEVPQDFAIAEL